MNRMCGMACIDGLFLVLALFAIATEPSAAEPGATKRAERAPAMGTRIPRFGMDNPTDYRLTKELGVELVRSYPREWQRIEPVCPQSSRQDFKEFGRLDLDMEGLSRDIQDRVRSRLKEVLPEIHRRAKQVQYKQDQRGMWHMFVWDQVDQTVRAVQEEDMDLTFSLAYNTYWASKPEAFEFRIRQEAGGYETPLKHPRYAEDVTFFTRAFVERYDGDGVDDMPGLKRRLVYWQNGAEFNMPRWWNGTNEEYMPIWRAFAEGVRAADSGALIISNGLADVEMLRRSLRGAGTFSPRRALEHIVERDTVTSKLTREAKGKAERVIAALKARNIDTLEGIIAYLDHIGVGTSLQESVRKQVAIRKRAVDFMYMVFDHPELYDIFDARFYKFYKYQRERIAADVTFCISNMEKRGYRKPFMPTEGSGAYLGEHGGMPNGYRVFLSIKDPEHSGHARNLEWYEREQAKEVVKLHATLFASGVDGFVWYYFRDLHPQSPNAWSAYSISGLIRNEGERTSGHRKPSFYAYQIMTSKLAGFVSARSIAREQIEFTFEDRPPVYMLWTEDEPREVDLSARLSAPRVKITHIVTELDWAKRPIVRKPTIVPSDQIPISETPVFAESL